MGCGRACNALISCIWLHEPAGIFVSNHLGPHLIDWWMLSAFSTVMDCQASPKSFSRLSTHVVESMQLVFNYRCIQLEAGNRSCMICSVCKVHFSVTYIIYLSVQCMSGSWLLGTLSKRVFETRTATGSELFSLSLCLHTTTFILLSIFPSLEMVGIRI